MKNGIEDLRNHLFETIEVLRDVADLKDLPIEIGRAQAIANVADKLIQSAKVEVDYLRTTGEHKGTGFLDTKPKLKAITAK